MYYLTASLLFLIIYFSKGLGLEEDSLKNALNSIENRQRQLATNYQRQISKDPQRHFHYDDEGLMYLDEPRPYDRGVHKPNRYPSKLTSNSRSYEDENLSESEEELRKALNERLLEQLMLDVLNNNDDLNHRPQKKSFFREREINEMSENLQNLKPELNIEDVLPSKEKSQLPYYNRRYTIPNDDREYEDDYSNSIYPRRRYEDDRSIEDFDPENLSEEELEAILEFFANRNPPESYKYDQAPLYDTEGISNNQNRMKRNGIRGNQRNLIQKRSTSAQEKLVAANVTTNVTANTNNLTVLNSAKNLVSQKPKIVTKREIKSQKEVPIPVQSLKPLNIKKKSIDWSNYFGVDKRSKKSSPAPKDTPKKDVLLDQYIQSYILQSVRNNAFSNRGTGYYPKRNSNFREVNMEEVNRKLETAEDLRTAEDLIINDVLKFTGAHEGINDPAELQKYREKVIDELAAAYNLEKLRNEIFEKSEEQNAPEGNFNKHQHTANTEKRVATKKENAELLPSEIEAMKRKHNVTVINQKIPTKTGLNYNKYRYEAEGPSDESCPALDEITDNCLEISSHVNDHESLFMPLCSIHYICSLCTVEGTDTFDCDFDFFKNVHLICSKEDRTCQTAAQDTFTVMKNRHPKSFSNQHSCSPCLAELLQYSQA